MEQLIRLPFVTDRDQLLLIFELLRDSAVWAVYFYIYFFIIFSPVNVYSTFVSLNVFQMKLCAPIV